MAHLDEILTDLTAEYRRLDDILSSLSDEQWQAQSAAPGWSVADVVCHLATTEEAVAVVTAPDATAPEWTRWDGPLDDAVAQMVSESDLSPAETFAQWRAAATASIAALEAADPSRPVTWAAAPLKPATLATTRIAEHWAHGLDITEALGIDFPDTERLRHIAWLGHSTIPYGASLQNIEAQPVRVSLTSPAGEPLEFGPADAPSSIVGSASEFCRLGAQRIGRSHTSLVAEGPFGETALAVLRNYAA